MPDGPLFPDGPPGAAAQDGAARAQDSFADTPPGPVEPCAAPKVTKKGGSPPAKKAPAWTANDLVAALKKCDGGTGAYKKALMANIKVQKSAMESGGSADSTTNTVSIDPPPKFGRCEQIETLVHELTNLSNAKKFRTSTNACITGDLDREKWIRDNEEIEYDGVKTALKAFDSCSKQWECKTSSFEWVRPHKDFDHYYKSIGKDHKEYWGKYWDDHCKGPYNTKHPPKSATPRPERLERGRFV